jgi:hypothetical protein
LHPQERADNLGRHPEEGRGQPAVGLVAERTLGLRLRQSLDHLRIGLQPPADFLVLLGDVETIDRILHIFVEAERVGPAHEVDGDAVAGEEIDDLPGRGILDQLRLLVDLSKVREVI